MRWRAAKAEWRQERKPPVARGYQRNRSPTMVRRTKRSNNTEAAEPGARGAHPMRAQHVRASTAGPLPRHLSDGVPSNNTPSAHPGRLSPVSNPFSPSCAAHDQQAAAVWASSSSLFSAPPEEICGKGSPSPTPAPFHNAILNAPFDYKTLPDVGVGVDLVNLGGWLPVPLAPPPAAPFQASAQGALWYEQWQREQAMRQHAAQMQQMHMAGYTPVHHMRRPMPCSV